MICTRKQIEFFFFFLQNLFLSTFLLDFYLYFLLLAKLHLKLLGKKKNTKKNDFFIFGFIIENIKENQM